MEIYDFEQVMDRNFNLHNKEIRALIDVYSTTSGVARYKSKDLIDVLKLQQDMFEASKSSTFKGGSIYKKNRQQ